LKEKALPTARKTGLPTLGKKLFKKSTFPTYRQQKIALDEHRSPNTDGDSRAAMLIETTQNHVRTSVKQRKGLHMCTLTHFAHPQAPNTNSSRTLPPGMFQPHEYYPEELARPRFQVILAGNAFFHIKEISTGRVRGFRGNHNEACALARSLELRG
jgi:hypothetical protein